MDTGIEQPAIVIEPVEHPIPEKRTPAPEPEPVETPVETPEREKVPA